MVECLRNLVCAGATPLAMTDNLNFGNPYKPENFYQLRECVRGLAEACRFFDVPVVGGNVSLYNESPAGAIDPTPTVSVVGFIEDEAHITRQFVRGAGERLILLGGAPAELGGSQFLGLVHGLKTGDAPAVDLAAEKRLQDLLLAQIRRRPHRRGPRPERGRPAGRGRRNALRPRRRGPAVGRRLDLRPLAGGRRDALLFGESQGRAVVAVLPAAQAAVLAAAAAAGVPAAPLGEVTADGRLTAALPDGALAWAVGRVAPGVGNEY